MTIAGPTSAEDLAETLRDAIMLLADMAADDAGVEVFDDVTVSDLSGYLTRDAGLELRFPDGSVYLLMVQQHTTADR